MQRKNVIVGHVGHVFLNLYIDILIEKCHLSPSDICVVSLDENEASLEKHKLIQVLHYSSLSIEELTNCNTITAISLNKSNAFYLARILQNDHLSDKLYIHLTDDEVARWLETKEKLGVLKSTKSNSLDGDAMYVLSKIKNFIAPKAYFKEKIEYLLERNEFNFIDGRDAFKSLPSDVWSEFECLYKDCSQYTAPEKNILIGAKRGSFSLVEVVSIIKSLKKENVLPDFKCLIFTCKKRKNFRIILDLYLSYLRYVHRCNIDVSYPTATNAITYNALIMSCSHLILQGRGSMSTARSYLSLGRGVVHVKYQSPNYFELTCSEEANVASYQCFQSLAKNIQGNTVDVKKNQNKILSRFDEKYDNLKKVYQYEVVE